jgi:D-3-phosphoglycerate dehydrogenase
MKKVLITIKDFPNRFPKASRYLESNCFQVIIRDSFYKLTEVDYSTVVAEADALIPGPGQYDEKFLSRAKSLKILSRMGSGMDNIDLDYAGGNSIVVTNSKGCNTNAVAEMAVALMLSVTRGITVMNSRVKKGEWFRFPGEELYGKIVGLLGFGMIAQRTAQMLIPFGARVISYDPYMNEQAAKKYNVKPVTFDELIKTSDIISVHIPALEENERMFNKDIFAKMKDSVYFINTARGILVDEEALYNALKSGKVAAAASDVFNNEPVNPDNKLLELENFTATPHVAGMTVKSMLDDSMTVAQAIIDFFNGKEPANRVV